MVFINRPNKQPVSRLLKRLAVTALILAAGLGLSQIQTALTTDGLLTTTHDNYLLFIFEIEQKQMTLAQAYHADIPLVVFFYYGLGLQTANTVLATATVFLVGLFFWLATKNTIKTACFSLLVLLLPSSWRYLIMAPDFLAVVCLWLIGNACLLRYLNKGYSLHIFTFGLLNGAIFLITYRELLLAPYLFLVLFLTAPLKKSVIAFFVIGFFPAFFLNSSLSFLVFQNTGQWPVSEIVADLQLKDPVATLTTIGQNLAIASPPAIVGALFNLFITKKINSELKRRLTVMILAPGAIILFFFGLSQALTLSVVFLLTNLNQAFLYFDIRKAITSTAAKTYQRFHLIFFPAALAYGIFFETYLAGPQTAFFWRSLFRVIGFI